MQESGGYEELINKLRSIYQSALIYLEQLRDLHKTQLSKYTQLEETYENLKKILDEIMRSFAAAIDTKSKYIKGHSEKVKKWAELIGKRLYLSEEEMKVLSLAAVFHDIGRVFIDNTVWDKPSALTEREYELVKQHPQKSVELIDHIEFFSKVLNVIKYHHERWDGKGYPEGLKEEKIPLESRILAVADAFDAMTSERPYRETKTTEEAIQELEKEKGKQFDPMVVDAFISILKKYHEK